MINNLKIVTFNIRCVYIGDGINGFIHRAGMICDKILSEKPDVIAFQEVTQQHLDMLERMLPEYAFFGHFRQEDYTGEGLFTAIRKETVSLIGFEGIWLSPTPYEPASRFEEQSGCPRICIMTHLRIKETGEIFRVYNVHLDHISAYAMLEGIKCTFNYVENNNAKHYYPYIVLGDFNAEADSPALDFCHSYKGCTDFTTEFTQTFHDYGNGSERIDYILGSKEFKRRFVSSVLWKDVDEGIYLSDHYPVCAEFRGFRNKR